MLNNASFLLTECILHLTRHIYLEDTTQNAKTSYLKITKVVLCLLVVYLIDSVGNKTHEKRASHANLMEKMIPLATVVGNKQRLIPIIYDLDAIVTGKGC